MQSAFKIAPSSSEEEASQQRRSTPAGSWVHCGRRCSCVALGRRRQDWRDPEGAGQWPAEGEHEERAGVERGQRPETAALLGCLSGEGFTPRKKNPEKHTGHWSFSLAQSWSVLAPSRGQPQHPRMCTVHEWSLHGGSSCCLLESEHGGVWKSQASS